MFRKATNSKYIGKFKENEEISNWKILDGVVLFDDKSRAYVMCRCELCGDEVPVDCYNLINGKSTKCSSCNYSETFKCGNMNPNWSYKIPKTIKKHYKKFNINIRDAEAYRLLEDQGNKCAISGRYIWIHSEPHFTGESYSARLVPLHDSPYYGSTYVWVHKDIEYLFLMFDEKELSIMADRMFEFYGTPLTST